MQSTITIMGPTFVQMNKEDYNAMQSTFSETDQKLFY